MECKESWAVQDNCHLGYNWFVFGPISSSGSASLPTRHSYWCTRVAGGHVQMRQRRCAPCIREHCYSSASDRTSNGDCQRYDAASDGSKEGSTWQGTEQRQNKTVQTQAVTPSLQLHGNNASTGEYSTTPQHTTAQCSTTRKPSRRRPPAATCRRMQPARHADMPRCRWNQKHNTWSHDTAPHKVITATKQPPGGVVC